MDKDLIPITTSLTLLALPPGAYGISYNIYTRKFEDDPPGVGVPRGVSSSDLQASTS